MFVNRIFVAIRILCFKKKETRPLLVPINCTDGIDVKFTVILLLMLREK